MGKRSEFERNERDFYRTPLEAVLPLLPHIEGQYFYEPCAGDGALVNHLESFGIRCSGMSDIEPQLENIDKVNALDIKIDTYKTDIVLTNPPWKRHILHKIINHFRVQCDTWLLFDSDWFHTVQAAPYLKYCSKTVSVGRVSWMENGMSGKDNCSWYCFQKEPCQTIAIGRNVKTDKCTATPDMFGE